MVGFGKKLREYQNPAWEKYYIDYKMMKKKLKKYVQGQDGFGEQLMRKEFTRLLDLQLEKIVLFLLEQEGHLAAQFAALGKERELVQQMGVEYRKVQCIEAYQAAGLELLQLLQFVEINATGLRKILKKFDRRVAYRLTNYYVATRANHPFSQLQQVFRHVGIEAMLGSLTRSLAELRDEGKSMYDDPAISHTEDPVIHSIKAALERLTNSTSFLRFLSAHALIDQEDEFPSVEDEAIKQQYNYMSLVLNLMNTFLYMVNTYIIVPSADKYAFSLGAAPTVSGVIIGSMAVAQLVSSIYLSAWSNKSYFQPLVFSSIVLLLGNVLYAVAYDFKSLPILIIGRLLCGLGSARAVNRRYITDWVPAKNRLQASAAFVSASALGMAVGPALAGMFEIHKSFYGLTINANTLPGLVMAGCWLIYLFWMWLSFKEPVLADEFVEDVRPPSVLCKGDDTKLKSCGEFHTDSGEGWGEARANNPWADNTLECHTDSSHFCNTVIINGLSEDALIQPLVQPTRDEYEDDDDDKESSEDSEDTKKPAKSVLEALKLLTTPVKIQLGIYFMLKYAMEILLSESSIVTAHYFGWTTGSVAMFLALLGLTVLPVNFLVGTYISNVFEDRKILVASEVMTCLGLAICFNGPLPYSAAQYVTGALITFVSAEVLEGVNLALLSKVMSPRLARGTYNNGLLSTEAGTLARVIADGTITVAGYWGGDLLLDISLTPALLFGLGSLLATFYCYNALY